MLTPRQIEANRLNAQKSTGPRTEEGKARSRGNAVKHGAAGEGTVLVEVDAEKVRERLQSWRAMFVIRTLEEEWLFARMITATVQVEACQERLFKLTASSAARALGSWDEDREKEVHQLAAGLHRQPSLIYHRLLCSKHGCLWLIEQWTGLGESIDAAGEWTEAQKQRAFDLIGRPLEFRSGSPCQPGETPSELVVREVARLQEKIANGLAQLDNLRRGMAARGCDPEPNPEVQRLQRYEAACMRRYHEARRRLQEAPRPRAGVPTPAPDSPPATTTAPLAAPAPEPNPEDETEIEDDIEVESTTEPEAGAFPTPADAPRLSRRARKAILARQRKQARLANH